MTGVTDEYKRIAEIAGALLGCSVEGVTPIPKGANNRVFKVFGQNGPAAVKIYASDRPDSQIRLEREFTSLRFLHRYGVECVPKPIEINTGGFCAAFEWVDGQEPNTFSAGDVDQMIAFAGLLSELAQKPDARELCAASASCFSGDIALDQLDWRRARLAPVAEDEPAVRMFLNDFDETTARVRAQAQIQFQAMGLPISQELSDDHKTLSPSDFGFHNTLRRPAGDLVFLDFEYFGWDDPVKLVADAMLHPGTTLPDGLKRRLFDGMKMIFSKVDPTFVKRYEALSPVFGLNWCLIILNDFLPAGMGQRRYATAHTDSERRKTVQLEKARALLKKIDNGVETDGAIA